MVKSLDKKWKEFLFAASGFGPNFMMVLMGAFYSDAINPAALGENVHGIQSIFGSACLVIPALFSILMLLGKVFDGFIDIPFASLTDNLSTKWGRRRPPIAVCFIPMVVSFAMCWFPVFGTSTSGQIGNTIWFMVWALIFFATYTMCLIAFYGSLSNVCTSEAQRLRVSSYKSFFDTISYCLVYALVPIALQGLHGINSSLGIDEFVFMCLPLMCTMLIPLFMIKEGAKYNYPENNGYVKQEKTKLGQSFKITLKNRLFRNWIFVQCCTFFGLEMFLVSMNALIVGGMGFNGAEMALVNTCAFAPVPVMLYLFKKLKDKKGLRFAYQTCLLSFALAILSFFFASTWVCGTNNKPLQYVISCLGGVMGSWAIGSFFMVPYLVPAQVSSVEEKLVNRNHSAMYFATQAFTTSVIGAIASYGVYDILKNIFLTKSFKFVWATATDTQSALEVASNKLGVASSSVFNLGVMLVPFIVAITCVLGFIICYKMPKNYSHKEVALELKRQDPSLDISEYEKEEENEKPDKQEIIFVQVGLSILSGFIFGFIWLGLALKSLKNLIGLKRNWLWYLLSALIPFAQIYPLIHIYKKLGRLTKGNLAMIIVTSICLPLLPINVIALSFLQKEINRLYRENEQAM